MLCFGSLTKAAPVRSGKKVAKLLPDDKQRYKSKVVALDLEGHCVTLDNGKQIKYEKLLSTIPLDLTLQMVGQPEIAKRLNYSSSHIVGIGLRGVNPHDLKCWLYYPEDDCPFYRCTIFSHYAKANCPPDDAKLPTLRLCDGSIPASTEAKPGPYWSLMFEISLSQMGFKRISLYYLMGFQMKELDFLNS